MEAVKIYNVIGNTFKGVMVFKYNLKGILEAFELQEADELTEEQVNWLFKRKFPYREQDISHFKAISNFVVSEGKFDLNFEIFWKAYKYKVKMVLAHKAWNKLNDDDKIRALAGIKKYDQFLQRKRNQEKAYPSTYLNQRYWEDDFSSAI